MVNTKTREPEVIKECRKMLARIALFERIYELSDDFTEGTKELIQMVENYKPGDSQDIPKIKKAFDKFTSKYSGYINSLHTNYVSSR